MKITTVDVDDSIYVTEYPSLGVSIKTTGLIVLFTSNGVGTVIQTGDVSEYKIGYHSDMWAMNLFIKFQGKIILENT